LESIGAYQSGMSRQFDEKQTTISLRKIHMEELIFGTILISLGAFSLAVWVSELQFYWSKNWDFNKESGRFFSGQNFLKYNPGSTIVVPARVRILVIFPLFIFMSLLMGAATLGAHYYDW
jgi:hypothetical protein